MLRDPSDNDSVVGVLYLGGHTTIVKLHESGEDEGDEYYYEGGPPPALALRNGGIVAHVDPVAPAYQTPVRAGSHTTG